MKYKEKICLIVNNAKKIEKEYNQSLIYIEKDFIRDFIAEKIKKDK